MRPDDLIISTQCPGLTSPVDIPMTLLKRHLGMPAAAEIDAALSSTVRDALDWFRTHGRPWSIARQIDITRIEPGDGDRTTSENKSDDAATQDRVLLTNGQVITSTLIARGLERTGAARIALMLASAGPEIDDEITRRWQEEKPDEAMCLSACAAAAVEHIRSLQVQQLACYARDHGETMIPRYSPGYEGWDLSDQNVIVQVLREGGESLPGPIDVGANHQLAPIRSATGMVAFTNRAALQPIDNDFWSDLQISLHTEGTTDAGAPRPSAQTSRSGSPRVSTPRKALRKWADQRLKLDRREDGSIRAHFRFDGSTCTNMGIPLTFDFHVELQPGDRGRWIVDQMSTGPSANSNGYQSMCGYQSEPGHFLHRLDQVRPLQGRPLDEVLDWPYPTSSSGCLCNRADQFYKWMLALRTIHFALTENGADNLRESDAQ